MKDDLQRQVDGLSRELSEAGQAPERDLWPGIAAGLDQVERRRVPRRQAGGLRVWQAAALAASVVLLIGVGYVGVSDPGGTPVAADRAPAEFAQVETEPVASNLEVLGESLRQLNAALAIDPDNANLAKLVLMVHKSRANVMRREAVNWIR